jgi:F-type H+-transporting ATPase subunit gamma
MTSLRAVKNKINSVKSIKKIFSVMQLIAASKMKKAQDAFNSSNNAINHITSLLIKAIDQDNSIINNILSQNVKSISETDLYVIFCSDRGLCGNYNSIIMRKITEILKNNKNSKIIIIGNKLHSQLERQFSSLIDRELSGKFDEYMKNEDKILKLLDQIFLMKKDGSIRNCKAIYVFSKNAMSKEICDIDLFSVNSLNLKSVVIANDNDDKNDSEHEKIIYEDAKLNVVEYLLKFYFKIKFFNIFRSAYFSELASRMIAMDNASRNAQEIQDKLTLFYNKKRQANITNDLIDIINGAENL